MTDAVRQSPRLPDDSAPLESQGTPVGLDPRVVQLRDQTMARLRAYVDANSNGKPLFSPKLTKWFFVGFALCGAVSLAVVGDPDVPKWVVKVAMAGDLFFGALFAGGPGFRRGAK